MKNPKNQPIGVLFVRTAWLIVSVTDSNVWPGVMTAGVRAEQRRRLAAHGYRMLRLRSRCSH